MRTLTIVATLLLCSVASADQDVRIKLAIQLELLRLQQIAAVVPAEPVVPVVPPTIEPPTPPSPKVPTYDDCLDQQKATGKPLVVFVGDVPVRTFPGTITHVTQTIPGSKARDVIIVYTGGSNSWHFPAHATDSDILPYLQRKAVQPPMASPFSKEGPAADGSGKSAGRWTVPKGLYILDRARFTQSIAVTNGRDTITRVPRTAQEEKWQVSGGMVGLTGWKSERYGYWPEQPKMWVGDINVLNSLGYFQKNRGWKREYPVGTYFLDVLSTDKGVFEVRKREKTEERWEASIEYRDTAARPAGYHGLKQACNSCHSQAGSGGYASGLVPGGDTVIGVPFPALEGGY